MRRLITSILVMTLFAFGLTTIETSVAEAAPVGSSVPIVASAALSSSGTITGSVSFAPAPEWDEQAADQSFTVALIDSSRNRVDSSFVSMSYGDTGSSTFSISYFNAYPYNHHFDYGDSYTIVVYPSDPVYQTTYLGGVSSPRDATYVSLPPPGTGPVVGVGDTGIALTATISGTLDVAGGVPAEGVQAIAVSAESDGYRRHIRFADVRPDGSYHIFDLVAGDYNVGFVPTGTTGQPGAGIWWKSKTSLTGASVVTLEQSQQKVGVNQTLPAGGVITGVVKDSQGLLVHGGSEVSLYSAAGPSDSRLTLVQRVRSADDGTYQFWGLPPGRYKVGFTTVAPSIEPSFLRLRSLDGTPLPTHQVSTGILPAVDIDGIDGGNDEGELSTSFYPYTSAWYKSPAATFTSAKSVVIRSSGQIVSNINGILPLAASFSGWQPAERAGGQNPSEKQASCACADPVDTFSGEFSESTVDLALPGAGPRVQVDRTYSASLAGADGPFGGGFYVIVQRETRCGSWFREL